LRASSNAEAIEILESNKELVLIAYRQPEGTGDGVEFLERVRVRFRHVVRVLLGSLGPADLARAIRRGAVYQYVAEPCHPAQFELTVSRALENRELARRHRCLSRELKFKEDSLEHLHERLTEQRTPAHELDKLIYRSMAMARVAQQARKAASTDLPILIQGETGTGKDLLARAVHHLSSRSAQPLMVQNCGAVSDELLHSELFGHRRGAFTGAVSDRLGLFSAADGGTIFLDEISEVSPAFQVSLLRVLQSGEFKRLGDDATRSCDVRVIAASNVPLRRLVHEGKFRSDLYFRLNGFELMVPPLRERIDDIAVLAEHIARNYGARIGRRVMGLAPPLIERLQAFEWPGNVRELENEVKRMIAVAENGEYLSEQHLSPRLAAIRIPPSGPKPVVSFESDESLKEKIESVEAQLVLAALKRQQWNQSKAAAELGLSRPGLANKIKRYGLREPNPGGRAHGLVRR
jgi:two-component system response regulator HupR/HoxA